MEQDNNILVKGNLSESIAYQSSSIVSKQLLKKPNGNITLFAFANGESLTEHTSQHDALVFVLEGEMDITVGGVLFTINGGDVLHLPANIPHGLRANRNSKMLLIMIK